MPRDRYSLNGNPNECRVLKDLQSLLRKSIGEDVIVVHYAISSLLPEGENYGSTMMKIDSTIKNSRDSAARNLPLVAKMIPTEKFKKKHFNNTASFSKEMFFFETLIPGYEELLKEEGVYDRDLLQILPKYYGGRLTMNEIAPDVTDDDGVLLMENLNYLGYYTLDRYHGIDYQHAVGAIRILAKFHALGMAVKTKNPKLFEAAKKCFDVKYDVYNEGLNVIIDHLVNSVSKNPSVSKYREKIKSNMEENNWNVWMWPIEQIEPWVTVIHGDFWVKNILFHSCNGNVDDIKLIDFQLAKIGSPQVDLLYFLCGSLNEQAMENHFDDLLDTYYTNLINTLQETGIEISTLSRESFDQQLQRVARSELFHCLMALKFFTQESGTDLDLNNMTSAMLTSDANKLFETRATKVALKFIEKNWL